MKISRGTPEQLLAAVERQIDKLGGSDAESDVLSASNIMASVFPVDEVLDFLASKGYDTSSPEVQSYAEAVADYMDMSREAYERQDMDWPYDLDQWYEDTQLNYPWTLEELPKVDDYSIEGGTNTCNIGGKPDILDDEDIYSANTDADLVTYETVEAGEDVADETEEIDEDADTITAEAEDPEFDQYITELSDDVSNELEQTLNPDTLDWSQDEDNMYVTVNMGGDIHDFTIPYSDLKHDLSKDTDYIVKNINKSL